MVFMNSKPVQIHIQGLQKDSPKKLRQSIEKAAGLLTDREIEVLQMVSQGLTNAQIGKALFLSPLTVNAHLRSIFDKLDVKTRTAAVHRGSELGLL
jgi:DNA-binding CsgD family transcriptional regulator